MTAKSQWFHAYALVSHWHEDRCLPDKPPSRTVFPIHAVTQILAVLVPTHFSHARFPEGQPCTVSNTVLSASARVTHVSHSQISLSTINHVVLCCHRGARKSKLYCTQEGRIWNRICEHIEFSLPYTLYIHSPLLWVEVCVPHPLHPHKRYAVGLTPSASKCWLY